MGKRETRRDRPSIHRPTNGDVRRCPQCGRDTLKFKARYRVALLSAEFITVPAWFCDNATCKFVDLPRNDENEYLEFLLVRQLSHELRAKSKRIVMKSTGVLKRASHVLEKAMGQEKRNDERREMSALMAERNGLATGPKLLSRGES